MSRRPVYLIGEAVSDNALAIGDGMFVCLDTGEIGQLETLHTDGRKADVTIVATRPSDGTDDRAAWQRWAARVRASIRP